MAPNDLRAVLPMLSIACSARPAGGLTIAETVVMTVIKLAPVENMSFTMLFSALESHLKSKSEIP